MDPGFGRRPKPPPSRFAVRSVRLRRHVARTAYTNILDTTVYAIYKRLARSYPVIKEIVLEELEGLDDETRAELEAMFGIGGRDEK